MRTKGKIVFWNDEKGYGFIATRAGADRTFVHIKAFANRSRCRIVGDVISYSPSIDTRGRPCAKEASIETIAKPSRRKKTSPYPPQVFAIGFLLLVAGAVLASAIPAPVLLTYLVVSPATFTTYALDKIAAAKGSRRTSESTLHLLALIGGWPGALIAQNHLRHKTIKQPFRTVFWATVVVNCALLAWLFTPEGAEAWRSVTAVIT